MANKHALVADGDPLIGLDDWNTAHVEYVAPPGTGVAVTTTVQAAIDAASSGNTIVVPAGEHAGDITCKAGVNLVGPFNGGFHPTKVAPTAWLMGKVFIGSDVLIADLKLGDTNDYVGFEYDTEPGTSTVPVMM